MGTVRRPLTYFFLVSLFSVLNVNSASADESQLLEVFQSTIQDMKAWIPVQAEEPNLLVLIHPGQPTQNEDMSSFTIQKFKTSAKYQKLEVQFELGLLKTNADSATYKITSVFRNENAYCLLLEEKDPVLKHEQCWIFSPHKIYALNQWGPQKVPQSTYSKLLHALERDGRK